MSKLLNQSQAVAVLIAMTALSKVGGRVRVVIPTDDDEFLVVQEHGPALGAHINVSTTKIAWETRNSKGESYSDKAAFAAAYNLNP